MFLNSKNKAPNHCLNKFHHDMLLNFSEESLFEGTDRTFKNIYVELPYPIDKPKGSIKPSKDTVVSLLEDKKEYLDLLENKRKTYKCDLKNIAKKKLVDNEFIYLPKHLFEFYQKKDPDKYFQNNYNHYYTDGVLGTLEVGGNSFLIYPSYNNEIFLLNVYCSKENSIVFKTDTPVYNISITNNSDQYPFVVREKKCFNILFLDENEKGILKCKKEFPVPILDAKLKPNNVAHIGLVWANGNFNVNDIETNKTLLHYKALEDSSEEKCDNFQQFSFHNSNLIYLMDNYKMKILDYRTKSLENTFDPKVIKCNSLCNFRILDNTLLLASRHYVMKADIRYLDKVESYSHTLVEPPCYMDIVSKNDDHFLALASQKHNSKVLFTGKAPYSLPYTVPSIKETLKETMLRDPTLILHLQDFEYRLKYSIAGLKILNLDGDIVIFTCNSLGEIFKQFVLEENLDNNESLEALSNWLRSVDIPAPDLHLTFVEEMSTARFALNTAPLRKNFERYKKESKVNNFLAKYETRYKEKNVTSTWTQKFISVWDDSDESDDEDVIDDLPEIPVANKVEDWIKDHEFADLDISFKES